MAKPEAPDVSPPTVVVHDPANVHVDGQHAGSVPDVLHNHGGRPGIRGAVLEALHAHFASRGKAHADEVVALRAAHAAERKAAAESHEADKEEMSKRHAATSARHEKVREADRERLATELARLRSENAGLKSELASAKAHVAALGGTDLAIRLALEERCRKAHAARAAAEAEIAEVEAHPLMVETKGRS
jgi:hypothetical protein